MNSLFNAALEFQNFIKLRNWDFCFIGGLAVIRWGEVRMTRDIDISILADFGDEEKKKNIPSPLSSPPPPAPPPPPHTKKKKFFFFNPPPPRPPKKYRFCR